ncbi:hypothetical protein AVEN_99807-1 [Araneus ventricosus]|uniref:Uncharacterized protein n=1 Tax=Araneus ventricosus TaxID=182803 RepID=A0A4Y2PM55_ARAVE|nr:hypothetical protein AVEN_99807-1 [Araneus ventricosus]
MERVSSFPKIKPVKEQAVNYPQHNENLLHLRTGAKTNPRPVELNRRTSPLPINLNNFPPPNGNSECEKEFYGFLEGVKAMYDSLKSIQNLIKSVAELKDLDSIQDRIYHLIKALGAAVINLSHN